ncbi:hypothetical protein ACWEPC_58650 [Nonomuraea sp. NPDC004297]
MAAQIVPLPAVTLVRAAGQFLARRDLDADTIRSYGQTLRRLRHDLGDGTALSLLTPDQAAAVFTAAWDGRVGRVRGPHLEPAPRRPTLLHRLGVGTGARLGPRRPGRSHRPAARGAGPHPRDRPSPDRGSVGATRRPGPGEDALAAAA